VYQILLGIMLRLEVMFPFIATRDSAGFGISILFALANYFAERSCREKRALAPRLSTALAWSLCNMVLFGLLMLWTFRESVPVLLLADCELTSVWSVSAYTAVVIIFGRSAMVILDRLAEKLVPELFEEEHSQMQTVDTDK